MTNQPLHSHSPDDARTDMCTLTVVYHEDFDLEITAMVKRLMLVPRYTKVQNVVGARSDSNAESEYQVESIRHMLIILTERHTAQGIMEELRQLRKRLGSGFRAYISPVDDVV